MQPGQDPTTTRSQAQSFFEYLHQQNALIQQRQQQTANLLNLLSQSSSTEITSLNPVWNVSSTAPASAPHTSPVRNKLLLDANDCLSAQQNPNSVQFENEEDELVDDDKDEDSDPGESTSRPFLEDMPTSNDFVNKLYRRIECSQMRDFIRSCAGDLKEIVSLSSPDGPTCHIQDMEACTKQVLPRFFKHSNFSSFVRQLNKYSFHKIKDAKGAQYGQNSWVFQHPSFLESHPEKLENIKRSSSTSRKTARAPNMSPRSSTSPTTSVSPPTTMKKSTRRRAPFTPHTPSTSNARPAISQDLVDRLTALERNQEGVVGELIGLTRELAERNQLIHLAALYLQIPSELLPSDIFCSKTYFQGYNPTFPSSANIGLEAEQQPTPNVMIQDLEPPSLTLSNSDTFRLIQPSFDQVDWSSLSVQQ